MVTCWQNGRRVLMHSSEVAKMMKEQKQSPSSSMRHFDESKPCMDYRVSHRQSAREDTRGPMRPGNDEKGVALVAREPMQAGDDEAKKACAASKSFDLTPPPLRPRSRTLAGHEIWQKLAKEMARVAGHPKRCHKSSCRRAKQCAGGQDACYLREFETVDVAMQRFLQSHARELRAAAQEGAGPAERDGAKP
ncbi:MAG: hypothetical protein KF748_03935 [Xanthobacteraceae bacterium]|nr:hypothetical protein [Xanthobacteraceae bacterium]